MDRDSDTADLKPFAYDLPTAPRIAVENWLARLQAITIVTALFAGVQSQLLGGLPDDLGRASDTALRFFAYAGLFLNIGGTLSSVLLLIAVTSMPVTARHLYVSCPHSYPRQMFPRRRQGDGDYPEWENNDAQRMLLNSEGDAQLLRAFGIARGWDIILFHCLLSFVGGAVFTFVQIAFTAWIAERTVIAALVLPFAIFGVAPPLYVLFFLMGPHQCLDCAAERRRNGSAQGDYSRTTTGLGFS
ncbi:hypothetical protein EXIGLDRAFT_777263 [Exidia glandulosa HHB12029]|uniref:Uncharacterized protein n=1 Tax=Exidia glandulosa HHB12029 TaxID=1314781 RepID=A0A165D3S9_EXIGL|nr:hypothetical protein EXIGLDRAFT_777263 [Exidia glandulosa HHB12029]